MEYNLMNKGPKKVGNYQLGELIGKGAVGYVYRGLDLKKGRIVAVKQIIRNHLKNEQMKGIHQEIELLKKLNHENIVKYIEFISTDHHLNIVLEYVEIGSFDKIIRTIGPIEEELLAYYVRQILLGLQYLHSQGIVHRDVKGANILFTKSGVVKLADFGVATKLNQNNPDNAAVGSPYWMAPEVIEMKGQVSASCDIWSLGCTVIELLTGLPPYSDLDKYCAMIHIVSDDHPPLPERLSPNVRDFLSKCFLKDPSERPTVVELLKHPWIVENHAKNRVDLKESFTASVHENMNLKSSLYSNHKLKSVIQGGGLTNRFHEARRDKDSASPVKRRSLSPKSVELVEDDSFMKTPLKKLHRISIKEEPEHSKKTPEGQGEKHASQWRLPVNESKQKEEHEQRNCLELSEGYSKQQIMVLRKEIIERFQKLSHHLMGEHRMKPSEVHRSISAISSKMAEVTLLKEWVGETQDLQVVLEILQEQGDSEEKITHACLEFFNNLTEGNTKSINKIVGLGIVSELAQYLEISRSKEIKLETVYFVGLLVSSGEETSRVFLCSGGLGILTKILDLPHLDDNSELYALGLNCILMLLDLQLLTVSHLLILAKDFFIEQLLYIIDNEQIHGPDIACKAFDCLIMISSLANIRLKARLARENVMTKFKILLSRFQNEGAKLKKIVKIMKNIAAEPMILVKSEYSQMIPRFILLIAFLRIKKVESSQVIIFDLLEILHLTMKLQDSNRSKILSSDNLVILVDLATTELNPIGQLSLQILKLALSNGPQTLQRLLQLNISKLYSKWVAVPGALTIVLNSLLIWSEQDNSLIDKGLLDEELSVALADAVFTSNNNTFGQLIGQFRRLLEGSSVLGRSLAFTAGLFQKMVDKIGYDMETDTKTINDPCVLKEILEIIYIVWSIPKCPLNRKILYPLLVNVLQMAEEDNIVVLEEVTSRIIALDSN
jgi:serine/threonine protein kinase